VVHSNSGPAHFSDGFSAVAADEENILPARGQCGTFSGLRDVIVRHWRLNYIEPKALSFLHALHVKLQTSSQFLRQLVSGDIVCGSRRKATPLIWLLLRLAEVESWLGTGINFFGSLLLIDD